MSQRMSQVGVMVLIKKAADTADKQKGFKIYPLNESTGRADYNAASQIVWKADVDALLAGSVRSVPVYLGEPLPPRETVAPSQPAAKSVVRAR